METKDIFNIILSSNNIWQLKIKYRFIYNTPYSHQKESVCSAGITSSAPFLPLQTPHLRMTPKKSSSAFLAVKEGSFPEAASSPHLHTLSLSGGCRVTWKCFAKINLVFYFKIWLHLAYWGGRETHHWGTENLSVSMVWNCLYKEYISLQVLQCVLPLEILTIPQ